MSAEILNSDTISTLLELEKDSPGLLTELLGLYRSQAPVLVVQIRVACEAKDTEGTRKGAHSLKGSSANLGAISVVEIALSMELEPACADFELRIARLENEIASATEAFAALAATSGGRASAA